MLNDAGTPQEIFEQRSPRLRALRSRSGYVRGAQRPDVAAVCCTTRLRRIGSGNNCSCRAEAKKDLEPASKPSAAAQIDNADRIERCRLKRNSFTTRMPTLAGRTKN